VDKPVLFTVGNYTQQDLWRPLSETYRLAFLNSGAGQMAHEMGIEDVLVLESFMTGAMLEQAKGQAMAYATQISEAVISGSCVLDSAVPALNGTGLLRWLPVWAYENAVPAIGRVFAAATCMEKHGSSGVLVHEDVTPEGRVLCQWGNVEGLPTLHMPHANHFLANDTADIHCSTVAQHIGASGIYMRDWYLGAGSKADTRLIGAPQWDKLYDAERMPTREQSRRAMGIAQDAFVLVYGGTWAQMTAVWGDAEEELKRGWELAVNAAKEMGALFIVKMHPGEAPNRETFYVEEMKKAELKGVVTRKHNEHVLRAADCVLTQGSSNLAVAATILGTPVVEIYQCSTRYPDYGPKGTWGDGLVDLIREAIAAGPLKEFERAMNYDGDGKAIDRSLEWIKEMCPV